MTITSRLAALALLIPSLCFSFAAYTSSSARKFDPCAGPPLPQPLTYALAQQQYFETDSNFHIFNDNLQAAQKIFEDRNQQRRNYRLHSELLRGVNTDLVESFQNPQPGDVKYTRPMTRYYFAYLHDIPVDGVLSHALDTSFSSFEGIEKKGQPTNYTWYEAVARSVLAINGNVIDPNKYFGTYYNQELYKSETEWIRLLVAVRDIEKSLDAKRYEEVAERLLPVAAAIKTLMGERSECANSPSIAVGEILQSYIALATNLIRSTQTDDSLPPIGRGVYPTLRHLRGIMAKAIRPIEYPALSARILRTGALHDRLQADIIKLNSPADQYRIAATKAEALASYLENQEN